MRERVPLTLGRKEEVDYVAEKACMQNEATLKLQDWKEEEEEYCFLPVFVVVINNESGLA